MNSTPAAIPVRCTHMIPPSLLAKINYKRLIVAFAIFLLISIVGFVVLSTDERANSRNWLWLFLFYMYFILAEPTAWILSIFKLTSDILFIIVHTLVCSFYAFSIERLYFFLRQVDKDNNPN